ncbi:hypothetical protein HHK36_030755 [Tetracentron sinense]|uniref:K-box domain-containing protein n=1 Tax=Tetracentron sinense TaxID=13715 RepID=A0A834Y857_TETSI|nr:hypothetical protein HHK36_030755 [Tetracentron sinense]
MHILHYNIKTLPINKRNMKGEELHGLDIEELQKLEKSLGAGLSRLAETKGERIVEEITSLQRKGAQLVEENEQMRQQMVEMSKRQKHVVADSENMVYEEGQSSNSVTNVCHFVSPSRDDDSSDTSLRLETVNQLVKQAYTGTLKAVFVSLNVRNKEGDYQ